MINTLFNHIKKHKWVYGVGALALVTVLVVVSLKSGGLKFSSRLSGNINWATASISEEKFGQEVDKIVEKRIKKIGEEKWERLNDMEREKIIDNIFHKLISKYELREKKERKHSIIEINRQRTMDSGKETPEEDNDKEKGYKTAEMDLRIIERERTLEGRMPKMVDPSLLEKTKIGTVMVTVDYNVTYSIYNVKKNINVGTGGGGMGGKQFTLPASANPGIAYKIVFNPVSGYKTPTTINFNLITGDNKTYNIKYIPSSTKPGFITVSTNLANGSYKIYSHPSGKVAGSGKGVNPTKFTLPATSASGPQIQQYYIKFDSVNGYTTPTQISLGLVSGDHKTFVGKYIQVAIQKGTLSASSTSGSIGGSRIVFGTQKDYLVSKYSFYTTNEAFTIKKLTVANNLSGQFHNPKDTNTLNSISIKYTNKNTITKTVKGTLTSGKYTFQNLDFYIPKNKSTTLEITANIKPITSGTFSLSGKKIRLGLMEQNTKATFEAIGESSSTAVYFDKSGDIKNSINVPIFIVRKSKPVFVKSSQSSSTMPTTNGDLYKFTIIANGGDVSFARFVFNVNTTGLNSTGTEDIYNWDFRNNSGSINGVNIWGQSIKSSTNGGVAVNLKNSILGSGLQDANTTYSGVDNGSYKVIVTFDNEETIAKGNTKTYTLRASIAGATTDDTLEVGLANDDETTEVSVNTKYNNDNGFTNTSQIIGDTYTASDSLFSGTAGTGDDENEYFGDTRSDWVSSRNIIWSDRSGGDFVSGNSGSVASTIHTYPTITGNSTVNIGTVTDNTGTLDWTNGYKLNIDNLPTFSFKK